MACFCLNHTNYNPLDCDWFKKSFFPLFHLPSCYHNNLAKNKLSGGQFVFEQFVIGQSKLQLNRPITFKVMVTCVRGRLSAFVFWCLIAGRRDSGLRMFSPPLYFNANLPFLS